MKPAVIDPHIFDELQANAGADFVPDLVDTGMPGSCLSPPSDVGRYSGFAIQCEYGAAPGR